MDDVLLKLTNAPFSIEFDGSIYQIRKANLEKAIRFRNKQQDLISKGGNDMELASYALWLVLSDVINDLSLEDVINKTPADIDVLSILVTLGFMSPQQAQRAGMIQLELAKRSTGNSSSQESPNEQDGLQGK